MKSLLNNIKLFLLSIFIVVIICFELLCGQDKLSYELVILIAILVFIAFSNTIAEISIGDIITLKQKNDELNKENEQLRSQIIPSFLM